MAYSDPTSNRPETRTNTIETSQSPGKMQEAGATTN